MPCPQPADHEDDPGHAIRLYAAESIPPQYVLDKAERLFLQGWFARPEYFGQAAHIVLDEHIMIDGRNAVVTHFTVPGDGFKYRGLSVVTVANYGSMGFACTFRDEDAGAAASICDAIITSARSEILQAPRPQIYPTYPPEYYPRRDDPDDPPDNDDQE